MAAPKVNPKTIVICCDGTGNEYGVHNTNVVRLFESLVRDKQQIAFYDPGVGTFDVFGEMFGRGVKKIMILLGMAFGIGLRKNLEDAYLYLMENYEPGDRVMLFGFSRGAYTVRALGGLLSRCGLLQRGSLNLVPYVSSIYYDRNKHHLAEGFKQTYCHVCDPHLIGVWDTVGSLGLLYSWHRFFDTTLSPAVKVGLQACAIDEQRKKFPLSLWSEPPSGEDQTIEQVWFAGVHSDIGGGYPEKDLSDIALTWMLERAEATAGLRLKEGWRDRLTACDPSGTLHDSRGGFWKLWPPVAREIPTGAMIHPSVKARAEDPALSPPYRPPLPPAPKYLI